VLLGTCNEDASLPYQPFVEALRHYVTHAPEEVLRAHVAEHRGELGRLIPELGRRIADLPAPQVAEAETERYMLFDAVAGLLSVASQHTPMVLVLDDLHWARAPELLLLKHLVRSAMPLRLLVLGTYRDSDLTRAHPLTAALADLRRETGVERLALHGLDEAGVVALMTAAAGHALTEPGLVLARAIHEETEGSPLFVAEILRNLTESGAIYQEGDRWTYRGDVAALGIPEGIKEAIGRRLGRLPEATNKTLGLAAVIGRQFDVRLLAAIADGGEDAVLDALDEATRAALVAEVPGEANRFGFSHALIRATLYEELGAARRARLHRKVGEALETLADVDPDTKIDELAYHWLAATQVADAAKAIGYARRAGDRALGGLAFEEAAAHYERALGVLQPRGRDDELLRCDLLIATAEARRRAGNPQYRETVGTAVELARRLGDAERLALAALASARSGGFMANAHVVDEALVALYEEASTALGKSDRLMRARLLGQQATELIYTPQRERRHALSHEAVEIARRLGDRSGLAQVLPLRLLAISDPFTLAERLALTAELAALADELGSSELAWNAAFHRAGALLESADINGAERCIADMERLAAQLRQPFYTWFAALGRATLARTRWAADAEARTLAAFEIGTAGGQPDASNGFAAQLAGIRVTQGRFDEVVDGARAAAEAMPHIHAWTAAVAWYCCETDRVEEARELFAAMRGRGLEVPVDWTWPTAMTALGAVCDCLQDAEAAAVLYPQLLPVADQVGTLVILVAVEGSMHFPAGLLASCLRRWDDAERHFESALAANAHLGSRPHVVWTRRGWAAMLLDRDAPGDRARARELIAAGRAEAEQLSMARELVRFERLSARLEP
jgi:predicted ATPase